MRKFSAFDWSTGVVAAMLICGPLLKASGLKFFSAEIATNLLLVAVGFGQLRVFARQAEISDAQRLLMEGQLRATEVAANAALAALDRPYISIESLFHMKGEWEINDDTLRVQFKLANYGKVPAFVELLRGVAFVALPPGTEADFPIKPLPKAMKYFPQRENLRFFRSANALPPLTFVAEIDSPVSTPGSDRKKVMMRHRTDLPFIISADKKTDFLTFASHLPLRRSEGPAPIETTGTVYLIGVLIYRGPDEQRTSLSFCYEGLPGGEMIELMGPPYNERFQMKSFEQESDRDGDPCRTT